jgi:dihydrofolate synthase/folylpolyglutamate synthase
MEVAKQPLASLDSVSSLPSDVQEPDPRYRAVLSWIWSFSARPRSVAELTAQRAVKLERMNALLAGLGHPERQIRCVLVAGTKGKGSTVAMISGCLQAGAYRTGRYTSPHLVNWRERTCVDAQPISTDEVIGLSEPIRCAVEQAPASVGSPNTFEVGTALALLHFARRAVDIAVIEVGTGGRFDATNLVEPLVSVIAPISFDHTLTLGNTLTSIAWHKAGIMHTGRPAVSAPQADEARRVLESEARLVGAPLEEVGRDWSWTADGAGARVESVHADVPPLVVEVGLLGDHQRDNATTALAALHALRSRFPLSPANFQSGLKGVEWPGRLQVLSTQPQVVLDGAHNAASAEVVRNALDRVFEFDRLLLVVGLSEGKDALGVLRSLAPRASHVILTRSRHERSAEPADLESVTRSVAPDAEVAVEPGVDAALERALAESTGDDLILVTGSLFVVGESLEWWRRSRR